MNNNERLALAEWVIKQTLKNGADEAAVNLSSSRGVEIEVREKKVEKLQESTQNSLYLQIFADHKYSGHSTNDLKKETLEKFIREAVASTKYLSQDMFRKLPDPKYYPAKIEGDLKIQDPSFDTIETPDRIKMALEIEAAARVSDLIVSASAGYSDSTYNVARMHSNGFSGSYSGTVFSAGAEVTVSDDNGGRPEDWYYANSRFFKELPSPEMLGKNAAQRALQKRGQKKIKSGIYDMLVENRSASRLLSVFQGAMSARSIQQKASFLDGMLDKKIASEKLTVIDDPFIEKGMGSRFFDGEGLAAKKRVIIDKGVLKYFFVDNYYGGKANMELTTASPSNIIYEYGNKSLEQLIKEMNNGILITGFLGGNSNSTTGDFSFGIQGALVEGGKITQALNEMNISGNGKEFFHQLAEVGNDPYMYSSNRIPSLLFKGVNFSGI